jgi:hypothetical protein
MLRRAASFRPGTFKADARTVEVVFTTGADVKRFDPWTGRYYTERLIVSPQAADLSRLNAGAPVLDTHASWELGDVIGVVERAWIENGEGRARLRLSEREEVQPIIRDIEAGVIRNVSAGYWVDEWSVTPATPDAIEIRTAVRWTPGEISFVPIPADPRAQTRAMQENPMNPSSGPAEPTLQAREAEVQRVRDITVAAQSLGLAEMAEPLIRDGATLESAQRALIETVARRQAEHGMPRAAAISILDDHAAPAAMASRMADALVARARSVAPPDHAREFSGASLAQLGRALLEARGERLGRWMRDAEIIQRSLTTSDFPNLLISAVQRLLQQRLQAAPSAVRTICTPRSVPDFRSSTFLQFAGVPTLGEVPESGDIESAPPAERGEGFRVRTFGRALKFTRQALVNDDLGALDQVMLFANAIAATEAAEFVRMFAVNGTGWGPTLTDGQPLFHSSHGNVTAGTMSTAGVSAARLVMRGQTDAAGVLIAPTPRYLLAGPASETAAEQVLSALSVSTAEAARPVFANRLELAVEPRLAGVPWFAFADPNEAPVLAFVTLDGSDGNPMVSEHETASFDGVSMKIVHDFTVAAMGFVGAVRATGA